MIQIIIIAIVYEYGSCYERVNLVDNEYLKIAYQVYDYSYERIFIDFKWFIVVPKEFLLMWSVYTSYILYIYKRVMLQSCFTFYRETEGDQDGVNCNDFTRTELGCVCIQKKAKEEEPD